MTPRLLAAFVIASLAAAPASAGPTPVELELSERMRKASPNNEAPAIAVLNLIQLQLPQDEFVRRFTLVLNRQVQTGDAPWSPQPGESRSNRPIPPAAIIEISRIAEQAYTAASSGRPTSEPETNAPIQPGNHLVRPPAGIAEKILADSARNINSAQLALAAAAYAKERGDADATMAGYAQAVASGDRSPDTMAGLGAASYESGDIGQAREAAQEALAASPGHPGALALLKLTEGRVTESSGAAAMRVANRGLGTGGGSGKAGELGGGAARRESGGRGGVPGAQALATAATKAATALTAAQGARQMRDLGAAERHATRALDAEPGNVPALVFRSVVRGELERVEESLQDAQRALALSPADHGAHAAGRDAFLRQRSYDEALRHADWVVEREPTNAIAHARRAHALAGLGRRAEAVEALRRAAELDERGRAIYEQALSRPKDDDLLFLFEEQDAKPKAAPPSSAGRRALVTGSFACGVLLLLLAVGLVATPRGRDTVRRMLNRRPTFSDHYDLLAETGRDNWSVFHEARDRRLDRLVAVRRLDPAADPERRRAFISQAKALAAKGKDVLEVYAVYDDPDDAWLVFERLERSAKAQRAKGLSALDPAAAQAALELLSLSKDSV